MGRDDRRGDARNRPTFNSIREYVTRASQAQPRLYVVEDLYGPTNRPFLLLEHLAERLSEIACVVLGRYRDSPSDITPHLAGTLGRLVRGRQGQILPLARHSEREIGGLLQAPPRSKRPIP